jgi:hypothetical protein
VKKCSQCALYSRQASPKTPLSGFTARSLFDGAHAAAAQSPYRER